MDEEKNIENTEEIQEQSENLSEEAAAPEAAEVPVTEETAEDAGANSEVFKWFAVRIVAGHENKVKTYLDAQIKDEHLEHRIRNVMIPMEKVFEVKNGKKKVKYKNFFPGYILIEADLDDNVKRFLAKVPSIMGVVGSKNIKGQKLEPIPLRDTEIKRIKAILNEESQTEKIDLKLNTGDPVKVTSGPFNNFNGTILEINTEKMKVKVMVSIFGRKTPIELEFTQIEKHK
ncbi:MAG: transcription termination/antitermination protein NusG [Bacteroidetes bacterium]|nr:transcription termination/antitermination protein NusG [Bacteroidota bacterium]